MVQLLRTNEPLRRGLGATITFVGGAVTMAAAMIVYRPNALSLLVQVFLIVLLQMVMALGLPKLQWDWEPVLLGVVFAICNVLIAIVTLFLADAWALALTVLVVVTVIVVQVIRFFMDVLTR